MKRITALLLVFCLLPLGAAAAGPELESKSACLMDVATGTVLYEKNAHPAICKVGVSASQSRHKGSKQAENRSSYLLPFFLRPAL